MTEGLSSPPPSHHSPPLLLHLTMQLLKLTSLAALLAALAAPAQADDVFTKCKTKLVPGSGRTTIHKPATTQRVTATIRPFVYTSKTVTAPASTLTVVTSSVSITEVPGPSQSNAPRSLVRAQADSLPLSSPFSGYRRRHDHAYFGRGHCSYHYNRCSGSDGASYNLQV